MTVVTYIDLSGGRQGTLDVIRMTQRRPEVLYHCKCSNCGTESIYEHVFLRNVARCKNPQCNLIRERSGQRTEAPARQIDWGAFAGDPRAFDLALNQAAIAEEKSKGRK